MVAACRVGTAITMQCHVLGVTLLPIVGGLLVADARSRGPGSQRRRVWAFGLAGLAIVALSFLPLVVHELTNDFSEVNAALDYLRAGGDATEIGPIGRFLIIAVASSLAAQRVADRCPDRRPVGTAVVIAIAVWCGAFGTTRERRRPDGSGSGCSGRPGS